MPTLVFLFFIALSDPALVLAEPVNRPGLTTSAITLTAMPSLPSWCPAQSIPTITMPSIVSQTVTTATITWPELTAPALSITVELSHSSFYSESISTANNLVLPTQQWISAVISYVTLAETKIGTPTATSITASMTISDAQALLAGLSSADLSTMTLADAATWIAAAIAIPFGYIRGVIAFLSDSGPLGLLAMWAMFGLLWVLLLLFIEKVLIPVISTVLSWVLKLLELLGEYLPTGG